MGERRAGGPGPAISPGQQMMASGTGAVLTSIFGEVITSVLRVSVSLRRLKHVTVFTVTPLDVVKIRLQAQQTPFPRGKAARHQRFTPLDASGPPLGLVVLLCPLSLSPRPALCFIALVRDSAPWDGVTRPSKCEYL